MPRARWRDRDHTRGSLLVSLWVLALPLMATSAAMSVYQLLDLRFIGELGPAPTAAVVITNQTLRQIAFLVVMGVSFAAQALIARAVGAAEIDEAEHLAGQSLVLGLGFAAGLALVGGLFPRALIALANPAPAVLEAAVPYVRLVFVFAPTFVGAQVIAGILNGAGDTTTPMVISIIQAAVGIVAEWLLIFGHAGLPALGISGVALGLAIGQATALGLGLRALFSGRTRVHLRARHVRPDRAALRRLLRLAWQPALQMASRVFLVFFFLRLSARFGTAVQAAYAIGLRLEMVPLSLGFPLANAVATLVGQNLGADDRRRAWQSVWVGLAVHGALFFGFAALLFFLRDPIVALFTDDPEVRRFGSLYLLFASAGLMLMAFYFVFFRALQGAGDMTVPMAISTGNTFLVTAPLGWYLAVHTGLGPAGIWWGQLLGSSVLVLATGAHLLRGRWARGGRLH
ncbi:MAG: MATE family efflux transporter [Myxococcota bacterium]|nr:MATE family efflux transporter [Myxococcota bacterium]